MPTQSKVRHGTLLTFTPVVPCGSHPAPQLDRIGHFWTLLDTFLAFPIPPPPTVIPRKRGSSAPTRVHQRPLLSGFVRKNQKSRTQTSPLLVSLSNHEPPTANRHPRESGDPVPQPAHTKVRFCPDLSAKTKNPGAPTSPLVVSLSNHVPRATSHEPRTTRRQPSSPRKRGSSAPAPAHHCPPLSGFVRKNQKFRAQTSPLLASLSNQEPPSANHEPPAANRHPRESGDPVPQPPHTIVRLCPDLSAKTKNSALNRARWW